MSPTDFQRFMLSDEDIQKLLLRLGKGQPAGFTQADADKVIEWATEVTVNHGILQNILQEICDVEIVDGELAFLLNERGIKKAEDLIRKTKDGEK